MSNPNKVTENTQSNQMEEQSISSQTFSYGAQAASSTKIDSPTPQRSSLSFFKASATKPAAKNTDIQQISFRDIYDACSVSLLTTPNNPKILYKRAIASIALGYPNLAWVDLTTASKLDPQNAKIQKHMKKLSAIIENEEKTLSNASENNGYIICKS